MGYTTEVMHLQRGCLFLFLGFFLFSSCSKDPVEVVVNSTPDSSVTDAQKVAVKQFLFVAFPPAAGANPVLFPSTCVDPTQKCLKVELCGFDATQDSTFHLQIDLDSFPNNTSFKLVGCGLDANQNLIISASQTVTNQEGVTPPLLTFGSADLSACTSALPGKCP